jgi:hypothetical protein
VSGKRLLMGRGEIQEAFRWTEGQFYLFLRLGLPVRKINGCWYGHWENIDAWLRALLKPGKPIDVRADTVPKEVMEG